MVGCESSTTRRPRLSCAGRLEGVLCDRRVPAYHPGCRTGKRTVSTRRCRGLSSNALLFCILHILLLAVALAESTGIWTDGIENGTYGYADHLEEVNYTFQVCHHGADQRRVRHASCVRLARSTGGYTRAPGRTGSAISTDLATAVHALKPYVAAACRRLDTSPPATQTDNRTFPSVFFHATSAHGRFAIQREVAGVTRALEACPRLQTSPRPASHQSTATTRFVQRAGGQHRKRRSAESDGVGYFGSRRLRCGRPASASWQLLLLGRLRADLAGHQQRQGGERSPVSPVVLFQLLQTVP